MAKKTTARAKPAPEQDGFLTFDEIIEAEDCEFKILEVPEWGGKVRLKMMSATEGIAFGKQVDKEPRMGVLLSVRNAVVDKEGRLMFHTKAAFEQLQRKSAKALTRISLVVTDMNSVTNTAARKARQAVAAQLEMVAENEEPEVAIRLREIAEMFTPQEGAEAEGNA